MLLSESVHLQFLLPQSPVIHLANPQQVVPVRQQLLVVGPHHRHSLSKSMKVIHGKSPI
jgi:hypothetical protein